MAKLNEQFDATKIEVNEFTPVPASRYNVVVTSSEMKQTKKGDGSYLALTFKILEGEYAGRLIWANLNLDNPNPKAVEIAQQDLASLCQACDLNLIEDSEELHNIPVSGQVKIKPEQNGYSAGNTISSFKEVIASTEDEPAPWGSTGN